MCCNNNKSPESPPPLGESISKTLSRLLKITGLYLRIKHAVSHKACFMLCNVVSVYKFKKQVFW